MSISAADITFIYSRNTPFEHKALEGVSCTLPNGTLSAIIGPTGSGKTTLVQLFNGLEKPTSGTIVVNGADIAAPGYPLKELRCRVGLVFQYPEYQFFEETVEIDIGFGPRMLNLSDDEVTRRVRVSLESVGMSWEKFRYRSPFHLSGGEQRRVAIASVLAMEPGIIVLDEPTAGLDYKAKTAVMDLLCRMASKSGRGVVIVTHDLSLVAERAGHAVLMKSGRVVKEGPVDHFFDDIAALHEAGIEIPQNLLALVRLRSMGLDVPLKACGPEETAALVISAFDRAGVRKGRLNCSGT